MIDAAAMRHQLVPDPRRPGKAMVLVVCWCRRVFTLTPEQIDRHRAEWSHPCPEADRHPRYLAHEHTELAGMVPA